MEEPDPIPLSALQHWAYCPRQCGLIHLEQAFDDNLHTQRGQAVHAQVDKPGVEERKGLRIERALPLWSDALGLIGKADVVEFEPDGTPYPVEYKHGSRHKAADIAACDDVQLAAQALCLEGMTGRTVSEGALYYASSRRRRIVPITAALREVNLEQDCLRLYRLPETKGCEVREHGKFKATDFDAPMVLWCPARTRSDWLGHGRIAHRTSG